VEVAIEASLTPPELARRIAALVDDTGRRAAMAAAAAAWAKPDAARRLADLVEGVAR
jgi:UDP-N-acetylglucosamine:LPS N-acetylglucosamine transferase